MVRRLVTLVHADTPPATLDRSTSRKPSTGKRCTCNQHFSVRARVVPFNCNRLEEQQMSRKQHFLTQQLVMATTLALGASGVALADDSSMSRLGGDSYAYFNSQPVTGNAGAAVAWRQNHPGGLTGRELQALSSSDLSAVVAQLNPQVFAAAPADPDWRLSHRNGLTERELQALSSSSLAAMW